MPLHTRKASAGQSGQTLFFSSGKLPWFASGELPREELEEWMVLLRLFVWKENLSEEDWRVGRAVDLVVRPRGFEPLTTGCVDRGATLEVNNFEDLGGQDAAQRAISCPENATYTQSRIWSGPWCSWMLLVRGVLVAAW